MQVALTDPNATPLWESQRRLNRGQAEQLGLLMDYVDSFLRDTDVIEPELMRTARGRATVESAAVMHAAEALGSGEGHVHTQYHQARFAREHLPRTWGAARAGDVPLRSLFRVVAAAERLTSPVHRERLDADATAYALTHRPAKLGPWLNRFVARCEPDQHHQRCRRSHAERRVWLEHQEDGISILHAMLPTLTAEAIKNRLVEAARSPKQPVPFDPCVERPVPGTAARMDDVGASAGPVEQSGFDWLGLPSDDSAVGWGESQGESAYGAAGDPRDDGNAALAGSAGLAGDAGRGDVGRGDVGRRDVGRRDAAAAPTSRAAGDVRTQAQREADLVAHLLLTGKTEPGTAINAHVGILIEPETLLAGAGEESIGSAGPGRPAISRNRRHAYPAEMIRRIIFSGEHHLTWTLVPSSAVAAVAQSASAPPLERPAQDSTPPRGRDPHPLPAQSSKPARLAECPPERIYEGRFVPKLLRRAIEFRDGTCQAPGCNVAAEHCDIDHQIPWPLGQTTASNLWALCRKHHRLKTAGFLDIPEARPPTSSP